MVSGVATRLSFELSIVVLERGVMLELLPGLEPMMCHTSQLSARKVQHPSALGLEVGQSLQVKCYGRDPASGNLSKQLPQSNWRFGFK